MNKELIRKIATYIGIIAMFAILSYGFVPEVFSGKIVNQSDISSWKGMTHEITEHNAEHPDDKTLWTNSMFGGMPTVTMYDDFQGDWTEPLYKALLSGARPANYLFISLLGAFLLMLALGIDKILAVGGAIAVTFCSYNMQIIQVGHNTKMQAIAFMPWVLAAIVYTYKSAMKIAPKEEAENGKKKSARFSWIFTTVLGSVLFALALSMQIKANHPQITYYLAIIIFLYAITMFVVSLMSKERGRSVGRFFTASALLLVTGLIGIATNSNKLIPTYEYAKYTMRGGTELTRESGSEGLELGYATAWSYGIEETPNIMIPDFNGGSSSGSIKPEKSETYNLLKKAGQPNLKNIMKSLPLYWGPQPFTAGPMYMGAVTIFLFVLGLALYRGREKWWLAVATVIAIFLAWGNHFMWFTRLWFDYAPMYNKFRTVSMALVILQITLPMLGFLVADRIIKKEYDRKRIINSALAAYIVTAGFCLVCVLFPGIAGTFSSAADVNNPEILTEALMADRKTLLVGDAIRSFSLITVVFALVLWLSRSESRFSARGRKTTVAVALSLVVLLDLWAVGKRYLNNDHFVTKRDFGVQFAMRPVDKVILADNDPHYRVFDISVNTFNDAHPSYLHKCIGGYSPAKLQRYQDLIDHYLISEIRQISDAISSAQTMDDLENNLPSLPITSMLNGKYIIIDASFPPVKNSNAAGNCWFVDSFVSAETPDEEITLLADTDLRSTAVVGHDFADKVGGFRELMSGTAGPKGNEAQDDVAQNGSQDGNLQNDNLQDSNLQNGSGKAAISLSSYAPNELVYNYSSDSQQLTVFSEIYYPNGWKAWLQPRNGGDKKELELLRVDWILRAAVIPAGEYEIVMRFEPQSYKTGENISRASSICLLLLLLLSCSGLAAVRRRTL